MNCSATGPRPATAALELASHGWAVLPLYGVADGACTCGATKCNAGKHPQTRHGCKDATSDPEVIAGWFDKWPGSNVGIATGRPSGLVVIDVDGDKGRQSAQGLDLPPTLSSTTGRGKHLFFKQPDGIAIGNRAGLFPGIDVRGDGGYVVAPPSLHHSGNRYRWDTSPDTTKLADPPAWLLEAKREPQAAKSRRAPNLAICRPAPDHLSVEVQCVAVILKPFWLEGVRHDLSLALSGFLAKKGWPLRDALSVVETVATQAGDNELGDRRQAVRDSYQRSRQGLRPAAWDRLRSHFPYQVLGLLDRVTTRLPPPRLEVLHDVPSVSMSVALFLKYVHDLGAGHPIPVFYENAAEYLGIKPSTVKYQVKKAKELKLLEVVGSAFSGTPQTFSITPTGQAVLNDLDLIFSLTPQHPLMGASVCDPFSGERRLNDGLI